MIKLEITIDCKKTEDALKGFSCIYEIPMSELIKEFADLNGTLIALAERTNKDEELKAAVIKKFGSAPLNDLLGILS